ncbi:hypothetical protein bcgnr5384_56910 [Bacillus cereus]
MANLSPEIISKLRHNSKARGRLTYEFDVHSITITRWLDLEEKGEETNLTTTMGINAISAELEVKKSTILID